MESFLGYHFFSAHLSPPPRRVFSSFLHAAGGKGEAGHLTQVLIAIYVALTQSIKAASAKWGPELSPHTFVC